MRRRKVTYPKKRDRPAGPLPATAADGTPRRSPAVSIDLDAGAGRGDFRVGGRVLITGTGLYSGESAVVESAPSGVIDAVMVRTDTGRTRRVRTIDLQALEATEPAPE